jgi:threonine/homoserine/homoserine lactone efflux protein
MGVVYVAVALVVDTSYVLAASAVAGRFMGSRIAQRRSGRIAAGTYVVLGVAAAATGIKRP